jgi:prefoldin subunit 5
LQGNIKTLEKEANRAIKKLKTQISKMTSERDHYKTAFTQMYKEKKARDEKAI